MKIPSKNNKTEKNWAWLTYKPVNKKRLKRHETNISALDSGSNGPGSSPGQGRCLVFLRKTLYTDDASLNPGVWLGTGEFNAAMD